MVSLTLMSNCLRSTKEAEEEGSRANSPTTAAFSDDDDVIVSRQGFYQLFSSRNQHRWRRVVLATRVLRAWRRRGSKKRRRGLFYWLSRLVAVLRRRFRRVSPMDSTEEEGDGTSPPETPSPPQETLERRIRRSWNLMRWRVRTTALFKTLTGTMTQLVRRGGGKFAL